MLLYDVVARQAQEWVVLHIAGFFGSLLAWYLNRDGTHKSRMHCHAMRTPASAT